MDLDPSFRSEGLTIDEWRHGMEQIQALELEQRRRSIHLEPLYYNLPDLLFPKGYFPGKFDRSKMKVLRKRLNYEETDEQYEARRDRELISLVTTKMFIAKDERLIQIHLIPEMIELLCDLFYGRVGKIILWANRGGGKSLLAALVIWLLLVYRKRSFINMGGAGNQARRVYDYTTQFWANVPGLQNGMLIREPLMERTELKNGTKLICATSKSTAIGEHIGGFVADEASVTPGTLMTCEGGLKPIEDIEPGDLVMGREGILQKTLERFSHPYDGRVLRLRPYGSSVPCWITEEHRVWAIPNVEVKGRQGPKRRKYPRAEDVEGRTPEWVRAWDLKVGDILCYPRFKQTEKEFVALKLDDGRLVGGLLLWRFLGYWAGDGGLAYSKGSYKIRLHLSEAKLGFLDDARSCMASVTQREVRTNQSPSRGKAIDLVTHNSRALYDLLRDQVGIKEERKIPHKWIISASDEELIHFLCGYLRTDGNAQFSSTGVLSSWNLTTTAPGLAQNVLYALNRLGISFSVGQRESKRYEVKNRDRWDIKISPTGAQQILTEEDFDGIELPSARTSSKVWYDEDWCYSVIKEIEEDHYAGPVYDLKMDGDPSFGTPACTMLHNCTDSPHGDIGLMRTMQGCLSEQDPIIFLLSTFHLPVGFFADMWDAAEHHGFRQYRWSCFSTMKKCDVGLETATPEDPTASDYCHNVCPLTWTEPVRNEAGEIIGEEAVGCCGTARTSTGWMTRDSILEAQRINAGTRLFPVEHACIRPRGEGTIYDPAIIDRCISPTINLIEGRSLTIGIDWGLTECGMVLIGEWRDWDPKDKTKLIEGVAVLDVRFLTQKTVAAAVVVIQEWQKAFEQDTVRIRADGSHPYANHDLYHTHGYRVRSVTGDKNNMGKDNVARWLGSGYLKIITGFDLFVEQMKNLRRDLATGKQVKDNKQGEEGDHGPDALRFALMNYSFIRWYKNSEQAALDVLEEEKKKKEKPKARQLRPSSRPRSKERKLPNAHSWRGTDFSGLLGL